MEKTTTEEVRKELLSAIEQRRSPTIDWVRYEKLDLGENWGLYVQVARQLEREGLVELSSATFTSFEVRRSS